MIAKVRRRGTASFIVSVILGIRCCGGFYQPAAAMSNRNEAVNERSVGGRRGARIGRCEWANRRDFLAGSTAAVMADHGQPTMGNKV
jgi:hypothetical protein